MEDISISAELEARKKQTDTAAERELSLTVSPVCLKEGKKTAYVSFSEGRKHAEGQIPDCTITKNTGFTEEEIAALESYLRKELTSLKKMASRINVMDAFMGKR